ncbi:MAG: Outer membrane protein assembly factor YaeT precursor [uncultured Campylobacterales bacterium]|uniref:Outer membrane protein assembly factor BamA n=1 Tax=uncultured Campylobacterales bacterium TaxID=352960 RepID=A0A6S6SZ18_9BACT|nr:MAG: Outer membrane protein assembly factor YaeT precursor [uncultured Campylobacterales bacterium]
MKRFLVLVILGGISFASTINKIEFTGLLHISATKAKSVIDIQEQDSFSKIKVNRAIKSLYSKGYFDSIESKFDGSTLTFITVSKPNIANIEILGFDELKVEETLKLLGLKKGMLYDKYKVEKSKKTLTSFLEFRGYLGSSVVVQTEYINKNAVNLKFVSNKGKVVRIKEFDLVGDNANYKEASDELKNKKQQFLGWLWGRDDGKLSLAELGTDYGKLKDYYLSNGYIDVDLTKPFLSADLSMNEASIYYEVTKGEQYTIGQVSVSDKSLYKEELNTKSGDLFDVYKLRADIKDIQNELYTQGFAKAKVRPKFEKSIANKTINIYFDLSLGNKVYVRNVDIQGNSRTLDRIIRRELYLIPGEVYTELNYADTISSLGRLGYFDSIVIDKNFVEDDQVDIVVNVSEGPTGSLIGSIGYGSDGLLLNANVNDRNIFGSGIEAGISVDRSATTTKGELYFQNPRFNDSKYSLGASIFKKEYDFTSYDEDKTGFSVKVGRKLTRRLTASLSYGLEDIELTNIDVNSTGLYREGSNIKSFVTPFIGYNSTDDFFLPRSGFKANTSLQYAGIGGDMEFIKSYSKVSAFYGFEDLIGYDLIVRYRANVQLAQDEGYLPINEKLYLGGLSTLRGFDTNSLSPENSNGDQIGGKRLFASSIEVSIPLIKDAKMRLFGFYDYGMIGESSFDEIKRSSFGWGIGWVTALGPLQFIFSTPEDEVGDDTQRFSFSIGSRF